MAGPTAWRSIATNCKERLENRFAETFPDCEVGAMSPFGNLYDVPACVDKTLAEDETIVFGLAPTPTP